MKQRLLLLTLLWVTPPLVASQNTLDIQRNGSRIGNIVRTAKAEQQANDLRPVIAEIQSNGAGSLHEIATQLNARGIQTARGCEWSPTAVMRVLA